MSMVIGAIFSPRSQARMRSWCQAILVPSRISSVWSVIPVMRSSRSEAPDPVLVLHLFHVDLQPLAGGLAHALLEPHQQLGLGGGRDVGAERDDDAEAALDVGDPQLLGGDAG